MTKTTGRNAGALPLNTILAGDCVEAMNSLPEASVDLVFLANVFHHLPEPASYFANAKKVLRPGGRVAITEVEKASFPGGHATPPEKIASEMNAAGYTLVEQLPFLERQSFQVFAPRSD